MNRFVLVWSTRRESATGRQLETQDTMAARLGIGRHMHQYIALIVGLLVFSAHSRAQDVASAKNRLTLFQNIQLTCKARVLGNAELANSFVVATEASLSEICECAALLAVANATSKEVSAVFSGDKGATESVDGESRKHFLRCIEIR